MTKENNKKRYDLEDRTFEFAQKSRAFIKKLPKTLSNTDDCRQLGRASGSVGANHIEANEAFSKKDFIYRVKICRKEAKEARYFLGLVDTKKKDQLENEREQLIQGATELMNIFGSMVRKVNP